MDFSESNIDLVYKNQKYLRKSLFARFKSVREMFMNDNYSFLISSEDKLRIVISLKTIVILNYIFVYIKKSKGNSYVIKILNIYNKIFNYLCNILFFPVVDFNFDKFSLKFRFCFDSSEYIINLKNLLLGKNLFNSCVSFDILYNFSINNKLWLLKNFPTYKTLMLFLLKNFSSDSSFLTSRAFLYIYDVFYVFFNFSLSGLVRCNYIVIVKKKF